jgi:hypothetical protein
MKAFDIIEAESPKKFFKVANQDTGYKQQCTISRMEKYLEPLGFKFQVAPGGGYWKKDKGDKHYAIWPNGRGADIQIFRWMGDRIDYQETVSVSSFYYLKTHVHMFGLDTIGEAENPKKALGAMGGRPDREIRQLLASRGFKSNALGDAMYRDNLGYRISVYPSGGLAKVYISKWLNGPTRLVDDAEFPPMPLDKLTALLNDFLVESALTLDPMGGVKFDPRPKLPRSIWTHQRLDPDQNPQPYHQRRKMENGKVLDIIAAFRRKDAPTDLLMAVKGYGPEVAKAAKMAADHIAWELMKLAPIHIVMPIPSSQPLAKRFARLIAKEVWAEYDDQLAKTKSIRGVPIAHRRAVAYQAYSVEGRYRGKTIVIVDDYVVTSSSMQAAAARLYNAGAKRVIGVALAI